MLTTHLNLQWKLGGGGGGEAVTPPFSAILVKTKYNC